MAANGKCAIKPAPNWENNAVWARGIRMAKC